MEVFGEKVLFLAGGICKCRCAYTWEFHLSTTGTNLFLLINGKQPVSVNLLNSYLKG